MIRQLGERLHLGNSYGDEHARIGLQLLPEAGATRRLEAVRFKPLSGSLLTMTAISLLSIGV
jgi:hypothetical protein